MKRRCGLKQTKLQGLIATRREAYRAQFQDARKIFASTKRVDSFHGILSAIVRFDLTARPITRPGIR